MKTCSTCGAPNPVNRKTCAYCGLSFPIDTIPEGAENDEEEARKTAPAPTSSGPKPLFELSKDSDGSGQNLTINLDGNTPITIKDPVEKAFSAVILANTLLNSSGNANPLRKVSRVKKSSCGCLTISLISLIFLVALFAARAIF